MACVRLGLNSRVLRALWFNSRGLLRFYADVVGLRDELQAFVLYGGGDMATHADADVIRDHERLCGAAVVEQCACTDKDFLADFDMAGYAGSRANLGIVT